MAFFLHLYVCDSFNVKDIVMKLFRNKCLGLWQKMLASLLTLLGFASCDGGFLGGGVCMYGTPNADYTIKGSVTDEDGKPLSSASVIVRDLGPEGKFDEYENYYKTSSANHNLTPDASGKYSITIKEFPDERHFRVVAKDAAHEADSVEVVLKSPGDDDAWYEGEAIETVDFKLKKLDGQN